jgi:hypothetical protein
LRPTERTRDEALVRKLITIIKNQPFHHKADELHALDTVGFLILEGDTNGDGRADFQIKIVGDDIAVHDILR